MLALRVDAATDHRPSATPSDMNPIVRSSASSGGPEQQGAGHRGVAPWPSAIRTPPCGFDPGAPRSTRRESCVLTRLSLTRMTRARHGGLLARAKGRYSTLGSRSKQALITLRFGI